MSKKRILIFIDWFSPGFRAGGPIRSCVNLVDHLKGEFDISIITSDTDYMEQSPYPGIKSDEWIQRPDGVRIYYFSKQELSAARMKEVVEAGAFDILYLNGIFSKNFTLMPLDLFRKSYSGRIVLAARGMLAPSALKIKRSKKSLFLAAAKMLGWYKGVTFHATNVEEVGDIKAVFGKDAKVLLAPNLPEKKELQPLRRREKHSGSLKLISIARIAPEKNLLFALQVLARLRSQVEMDLYGPVYDTDYWNECRKLMEQLPANIKVIYKGVLEPGRVEEELSRSHFLFMPTRGENFGHIILQSLSAGTPVIISDQTPWKDLASKKAGVDLPLDDLNNFVMALEVSALLTQEEYDGFSKGAYDLAVVVNSDPQVIALNRSLFA